MKLKITVEVIRLDEEFRSAIKDLPKTLQDTIAKMPASDRMHKSVLVVDTFPPKLIDNKAVKSYFPMLEPRTFSEAVALLRDCDNLVMTNGPRHVRWAGIEFLDRSKAWSPTPNDILSENKDWYVYSKTKSDQEEAEFPGF